MPRAPGARTLARVSYDETPPLLRLPVTYAVALALRNAGVPDERIARELAISTAALPALLAIGDAKLRALSDRGAPTS
jgi:hypothetical protein